MAINMDAVLELTAKVDGQAQVLGLSRAIEDLTRKVDGQSRANAGATQSSGLFTAASVALGNVMVDAAYKALEFGRATIAAGFNLAQTETRLRMLSEGYGEYDAVQQLVAKNAQTLGQSQVQAANGFADIYARLRPIGVSLEDVNNVYLGFNSLAMQSGTTAEAASGAFMQLSQALGSGTLRGDEFNSVAEQVPGILTEVAQVMGQPVGALRGLAAEGKITSDVVIQAMRNAAAEGSASLGELTKSAANAGNRLSVAFQDAQAVLGKELVPALAPFMDGLTEIIGLATDYFVPIVQDIAEGWEWVFSVINDQILPIFRPLIDQINEATGGLDVRWLAEVWQGMMVVSIQRVVDIMAVLVPIVTKVVEGFQWLYENSPFKFIADQVFGAAEGMRKVRNETIGTNEAADATGKTLGAVASTSRVIATTAADTKEELKRQKEELKEQQDRYRELQKLSDATYDRERARLEILIDQAEAQRKKYDGTQQEFIEMLRIRDLELKRAESEYKAAQGKIRSQVDLNQMTQAEARIRLETLKIQYDSTKATIRQEYQQELLNERAERQKELQAELTAQTNATRDAMAEVAVEVEAVSAEIKAATTHTIRLHNEIREVDLAVVRVSRGWMSVQQETLLAAEAAYNYQESIQDTAERIRDLREEGTIEARRLADAIRGTLNLEQLLGVDTALRRMATGGYVTSPTPALIGEGGEPEYVIPASRMAAASTAFLGGARGGQVLAGATSSGPMAVNIQTGPVMSMGGQQFVSKTDLSMAVTQAVQQTMRLLSGNSNVRQLVGI